MGLIDKSRSDYLSKTLFIKGLQCHKNLFLNKYHPELKDEVSEALMAIFNRGSEVGIVAQQLFPGGVNIPYEGQTKDAQVRQTQHEIEKGTSTIYEASFVYDGSFVKVDILHKTNNRWNLYEVKSPTGMEDVHIDDVAFQYYVLQNAGLDVSRACLVHINNQYTKNGSLELDKLFVIRDLTDVVKEKQPFIASEIQKQKDMLKSREPEIDIGEHCKNPYQCAFKGHCWAHIPEQSVFSIKGRGVDKFGLYRKGVIRMEDIPRDILNRDQLIQVEGMLSRKNLINANQIKKFIGSLWYPLCFLDFETFDTPIPPFDGTRPYQKIPFQYSLHCLESEGRELKHHEFLGNPEADPRRHLIEKLVHEIPDNACVLAYNMTFEKKVLKDLSEWFPEYKAKIETITANIRDLMVPFKAKHCYLWQMNGSYSLKLVLPALVPDMGYNGMEISDGGMASNRYLTMSQIKDPDEIQKIRNALLDYCCLDTLAMVKIVEKLRELTLS
jgi:hypothetical protein